MGSISKIETLGLLDGPGIRTVVFLNGCPLRCKYCHNPETWQIKEDNYTEKELVEKLKRNKPYYKASNGGVTFSGGEPLTQLEYLTKVSKLLKKENIHIALDTSGQTNKNPQELLKYIESSNIRHKTHNKRRLQTINTRRHRKTRKLHQRTKQNKYTSMDKTSNSTKHNR